MDAKAWKGAVMHKSIRLECPKCAKQMLAERQPEDPRRAVKVHIQCPECNGGDFDTPHYFDAKGEEVLWSEDFPINP